MLWLLDTPAVNGLFNLGTGQARSYLDLAHAVCDAAGVPRSVEFIDMPEALRGQYQSFTQAPMERLRAAGYAGQFTPLEEGVRRYVQDYLAPARSLRMIPVLLFPQFDPVIVQIGPFGIRWYALAYIAGLVLGWRLVRRLVRLAPAVATPIQVDDFLTWATLGVVLGGRLGYVLFYQPQFYLTHPRDDPRRLGRRHELPRRRAGRGDRDRVVLPPQRHSAAGLRRPGRGVRADRSGPRADRQLHQWRTVGPAGAGLAALGDDLSRRRPGAAASQPALPGAAGRPGAVPGDVRAVAPRATCAPASAG